MDIIINIVFIILQNNNVLYKHRAMPKTCLKTLSGAQQGVQVLLRFWFKPCLGLHERNHLMRYFRRIWKHLKDKSSVSGRLTFIDFLHHLVGIKINCSHFMNTLNCSGCLWLPFPGTENSTGGTSSDHPLHSGTRLHWHHQCHPRQ